MIEIQIKTDNGFENLILKQDTEIRIELNSSLFAEDFIPGNKSFSFDIPVCSHNNLIFKSSYILHRNKIRLFDCNFLIDSMLVFSGNLILNKISNKDYYSAQLSVVYFVTEFSDKSIRELNYGDDIVLGDDADAIIATCSGYIAQSYPDVKCQFPEISNNAAYSDENNPDWNNTINGYTHPLYRKNISTSGNTDALSPQPYLIHIIKAIFENQNYKITGDIFDDEEFLKLLLYSNYLLDELLIDKYISEVEQTIVQNEFIPGVWRKTMLINFDTIIKDDDSLFNLTTEEYTTAVAGFHEINIETYAMANGGSEWPGLEIQIQLFFDGTLVESYDYPGLLTREYYFSSDNFTYFVQTADVGKKITVKVKFITEDRCSDYYIRDSLLKVYPREYDSFNIYKGSFNIKNIVPDVTINYFLNAIKNFFKLGIFFNFRKKEIEIIQANDLLSTEKYFEIDDFITDEYEIEFTDETDYIYNFNFTNDGYITDNFKEISDYYFIGSYDTRTDAPSIIDKNQICFIKSQNQYLVTREDATYSWKFLSDNFYNFNSDGNIEFKPNISPMFMNEFWLMSTMTKPGINQEATSDAFGTINYSMGLRLMIWHGLQDSKPYASNNNYNKNGTIVGDLSLRFDDDTYGIYNKWHSKWHELIKDAENVRVIGYFPKKDYIYLKSLLEPNSDNCHKIMFQNIIFIPQKISALISNNKNKIKVEIIMVKRGNIEL